MDPTRAAFVCAALVLLVLLLQPLTRVVVASARPSPSPIPSPSLTPPPQTPAVAFFGSASDPFCAALYPALDRLSAANGWRLIRYDCRGNATNQKGQIKDFLRTETADIAVVCSFLEQEELEEQVKALREACPVITVGGSVSAGAKRDVAAHVGVDETERIRTLAAYFGENLEENCGVLLLCDVPDEAAEERYEQALSEETVPVLDKAYSWGGAIYVEQYLTTGIEDFSNVGGAFCTSRHGAEGAANALEEKGLRDGMLIASLTYEPTMADDLALGRLDAAVAVSEKEAEELLAEILSKGLKGEQMEGKTLTPILLTPENIDTVDLGY